MRAYVEMRLMAFGLFLIGATAFGWLAGDLYRHSAGADVHDVLVYDARGHRVPFGTAGCLVPPVFNREHWAVECSGVRMWP